MQKLQKLIARKRDRKTMCILFLQRMISIRNHIRSSIEKVSFDMLYSANQRIEYELQFEHSLDEQEQIGELIIQSTNAREEIVNILKNECKI